MPKDSLINVDGYLLKPEHAERFKELKDSLSEEELERKRCRTGIEIPIHILKIAIRLLERQAPREFIREATGLSGSSVTRIVKEGPKKLQDKIDKLERNKRIYALYKQGVSLRGIARIEKMHYKSIPRIIDILEGQEEANSTRKKEREE